MTSVSVVYPCNDESQVVIHVSKTPTGSPTASPQESLQASPKESPTASPQESPVKPRRHRCDLHDPEWVLLMAKWALVMESIEKNTRPAKVARLTMVYNTLAILSLTLAMFFTLTMTYILWIGFYPPTRLNSPFFLDRLNDFRGFLEGLQNGSIFQGLTDMLADSMVRSVQKEMERRTPTLPPLPPVPMFG